MFFPNAGFGDSPSPKPRKVEETDDEKWAATEPGAAEKKAGKPDGALVAEALWSGAEWAVASRLDHPRATVVVLLLGDTPLRVLGFQTP